MSIDLSRRQFLAGSVLASLATLVPSYRLAPIPAPSGSVPPAPPQARSIAQYGIVVACDPAIASDPVVREIVERRFWEMVEQNHYIIEPVNEPTFIVRQPGADDPLDYYANVGMKGSFYTIEDVEQMC